MFCFASSQLQAETRKFSTEDRTNKFKPLRQENFCFLLRFARNETSLRGDKADEQKQGSVYMIRDRSLKRYPTQYKTKRACLFYSFLIFAISSLSAAAFSNSSCAAASSICFLSSFTIAARSLAGIFSKFLPRL